MHGHILAAEKLHKDSPLCGKVRGEVEGEGEGRDPLPTASPVGSLLIPGYPCCRGAAAAFPSVCSHLDGYPGISCSKTPWEGQSRQSWGQPGGTHGNTEVFATQFRTGGAFPAFPGPAVLWAHWGVLGCLLCAVAASWVGISEESWPLECWFPWESRGSHCSHRGGQTKHFGPAQGGRVLSMSRSTEPDLSMPAGF